MTRSPRTIGSVAGDGPSTRRSAGADARQQLFGAERLRDVVVCPCIQRAHLVAFGAARGEHQDRHARRLSHRHAHLDAVDVRQAEVEHEQVWLVAVHRLERRACPVMAEKTS